MGWPTLRKRFIHSNPVSMECLPSTLVSAMLTSLFSLAYWKVL